MEQLKSDLDLITGQSTLEPGETMLSVLKRLDASADALDIPAKLKHYLSQRSYVKALAWLQDPSTPHQL